VSRGLGFEIPCVGGRIVTNLLLFKQAFNRQVWCTIEFSIRFLRFSLLCCMWKTLGFDFCFQVLVHCSLLAWIWKFSAQTPSLLDCGGSIVVFLCKNVGFGVVDYINRFFLVSTFRNDYRWLIFQCQVMWMSFFVSDSCYLDSCCQTLLVCRSVALESTFVGVCFYIFPIQSGVWRRPFPHC
jgi:hypothetical protein